MSITPNPLQPPLFPAEENAAMPAQSYAEDPPWTGGDVAVLVIILLIGINVAGAGFVVAAMWFHVDGSSLEQASQNSKSIEPLLHDVRLVVPAQFLAYVAGFIFMVLTLRLRYRQKFFEAIRWNWPAGHWLGFLMGGMLLAFAVELSSRYIPVPTKPLPIENMFSGPASGYILAAFGILAAPFMEELFFRGYLYPVLARRMSLALAIGITALGFMLVHAAQLAAAWGPLVMLFLVGVVLTMVRARTHSVASSLLVHVGYNSTIFILLWIGTDGFHHFEHLSR